MKTASMKIYETVCSSFLVLVSFVPVWQYNLHFLVLLGGIGDILYGTIKGDKKVCIDMQVSWKQFYNKFHLLEVSLKQVMKDQRPSGKGRIHIWLYFLKSHFLICRGFPQPGFFLVKEKISNSPMLESIEAFWKKENKAWFGLVCSRGFKDIWKKF